MTHEFNIKRTEKPLAVASAPIWDMDVRTGGEELAQAVSGFGRTLMQVGDEYELIEARSQLSEAQRKARLEIINLSAALRQNNDPSTYDKAYDEAFSRITEFGPKNDRAAWYYREWLKEQQPKIMEGVRLRKENRIEDNFIAEGLRIKDEVEKTGNLRQLRKYIGTGIRHGIYTNEEATKILMDAEENARRNQIVRLVRAGLSDEAQRIVDETKDLDPTKKLDYDRLIRSESAAMKRQKAEERQIVQEETASQLLADLWDGKLKDPQIVTDALRADLISDTNAKYIRKAMLNPDPPKLDLRKYAEVKSAIIDMGTEGKTRSDALSVLYANLDGIDPVTGKALVAEIFSEQDKNVSEMKREGKNLMEELIRDRDKFSGFFTDDERQILGTAEALLMLDNEIKKASKDKKPLTQWEVLKKSIEIGRQVKRKIKQEEEKAVPPSFNPVTVTNKEGEIIATERGRIPEESPFGLEDIWNDLNDEDKVEAMKLLFSGEPASKLVEHYKKYKK